MVRLTFLVIQVYMYIHIVTFIFLESRHIDHLVLSLLAFSRFDDTNPAKENEEFETSIVQDTKLLNVDWASLSHTSDYFEKMQEMCERLIKEGKTFRPGGKQEGYTQGDVNTR